jgi:hypothetical protein
MHFARRVLGALILDAAAFEDVEADSRALIQAGGVVAASSVAAGVGLSGATSNPLDLGLAIAAALAAWISWAALVYYLGVTAFAEVQTRADLGQLARTIGFSAAPGLFLVLLIVPRFRVATFLAISLWMTAAMVVAVRQALDYRGTIRSLTVCLVGWVLVVVVGLVVGFRFGSPVS